MKRRDISDVEVVRACRDGHPASLALLMERTGAPEKVASAAMERALDRRLIDYGVSLRTSWAEPAGLQLLDTPARTDDA